MPNRYQYQIEVNGSRGPILDQYPGEQWTTVAEAEDRVQKATLYRRFITDKGLLEDYGYDGPCLVLGDQVICEWEIFAEIENW